MGIVGSSRSALRLGELAGPTAAGRRPRRLPPPPLARVCAVPRLLPTLSTDAQLPVQRCVICFLPDLVPLQSPTQPTLRIPRAPTDAVAASTATPTTSGAGPSQAQAGATGTVQVRGWTGYGGQEGRE